MWRKSGTCAGDPSQDGRWAWLLGHGPSANGSILPPDRILGKVNRGKASGGH